MRSLLSQGGDSVGPGAHEMGNFGRDDHKISLMKGNIFPRCYRNACVGLCHAVAGFKAFLATCGPDPALLLSFGLSVLLSFPHSPSDHGVLAWLQPK